MQDEWKIKVDQQTTRSEFQEKKMLRLVFYIPHGRYAVKEQYLLHDGNTFIAEAGGYLGLLLGHSALGLVYMLVGRCAGRKKGAVAQEDE